MPPIEHNKPLSTKSIHDSQLLEVLARQSEWATLGEGIYRKECFCQNYQLDNRFIIKLFNFPSKRLPTTIWWQQEDRALALLSDKFSTPKTYGYIEVGHKTTRTAILVREKIAGNTLKELGQHTLTREQCTEVGAMLAHFHNNNIVTRDCHLDNLLLNEQQTLSFIDFGKSRIFRTKSMAFFFQAGWDYWKAKWRCTRLDPTLSRLLLDSYWKNIDGYRREIYLYKLMQWLSAAQQRLRLLKRKFKKTQHHEQQ